MRIRRDVLTLRRRKCTIVFTNSTTASVDEFIDGNRFTATMTELRGRFQCAWIHIRSYIMQQLLTSAVDRLINRLIDVWTIKHVNENRNKSCEWPLHSEFTTNEHFPIMLWKEKNNEISVSWKTFPIRKGFRKKKPARLFHPPDHLSRKQLVLKRVKKL